MTVPFKRMEHLHDSPEAISYMLADNKLTEKSDWNYGKLETNFNDLKVAGFDVTLTGFDDVELKEVETKAQGKIEVEEDDFDPESVEESIVQPGDIWQLGNHRLMCGDSTITEDVETLMNGNKAELLFTSPPYSNMRDYNGDKELDPQHLSKFISTFHDFTNYQVVNLGLQFKDGEVVQYWTPYIDTAKDVGYKLLAWNIWDKKQAGTIAQSTNMFLLIHEWLFVFGKSRKRLNRTIPNNHKSYKQRGGMRGGEGSMLKSVRQKNGSFLTTTSKTYENHQLPSITRELYDTSSIRGSHPAVFPIRLPSHYIEAMTNSDEIVIDPFCGSGTTIIACEQLNRTCHAMELDPHYCDVIIKRWEDFTGQKAELIES